MADGMDTATGFTVVDGAGIPASEPENRRGPPQRDKVLEVVLAADLTFWRDADGAAYATIPEKDGCGPQRHAVRSSLFRLLLRALYGAARQRTVGGRQVPGSISDTAMAEVLPALEAMALGGRVAAPAVRSCQDRKGAVWLDLGRKDWSVVRIAGDGWRVLDGADAPLVRPAALRALPVPVHADRAVTLARLRRLLNLDPASLNDLRLVVGWMVGALHPVGPYPVLALDGEQGSGKSTTCRVLRGLIDPNKADLRTPPRSEDDLIIAAMASRVVALDNVSAIDNDAADALCRLATGGGLSKRTLYTDGEEHLVAVCRPVLLNGIPSLLARGDLADRALAVTLPAIPDDCRRTEVELRDDLADAAPAILGLLLDGLARALRDGPGLHLPGLPRMADFARLACAAAPAFGWTSTEMLAAILANRAATVDAVIEADPVAVAVRELASTVWTGTATDLLVVLARKVPDVQQRERSYPKDAARLSSRLRRLAPALRRDGVELVLPATGGRNGRNLTIRPGKGAVERSECSERSATTKDADTGAAHGNHG